MKTQIYRTLITLRSITFLIILFCITFSVSAQNTSPLKVLEFRNIPNGIIDEGKIDRNHLTDYDSNPVCEIIVKAQGFDEATLQKLIFVPRNIMIMQKDYDNGQYRLYVSSKKLGSIVMKYQGDCEWVLPYELKPKAIYELTLGMETATLVIKTSPANAKISIDNEEVGTGYASKGVSIGAEHRYKVECENYYPKEDVVLFTSSEKKELIVNLEPAFGFITVKTTPSGADVYVDDKLVGKTPYLSEIISPGMHKITVNKDGYETAVKRLTINLNEEQTVEFTLVEGESSMPVQTAVVAAPDTDAPIKHKNNDNQRVKTETPRPTTGVINGHEYVDLGLPSGTLWATCNVGAEKPEEYGAYFSWGETKSKNRYNKFSWIEYKYYDNDLNHLTKYITDSRKGIVDDKTLLELEDDVAQVKWGGSWRIPTADELNELVDNCIITHTKQGGTKGILVVGFNGNSIFLPAGGWFCPGNLGLPQAGAYGFYWSSSIYDENNDVAYYLFFQYGNKVHSSHNRNGARRNGMSIRPVCSPQK